MKEKSLMNKERFEDEWLTPKEAASILKIHRSTIYRWANEGLLTLYNLGNRLTRLKRTEVEKLMKPKRQNNIVAMTSNLEEVFMPLARKHNVEEQKAQKLMKDFLGTLRRR
ncbi:MAG: helix-turn-helix domain-containing protein [Candidatus Poribacteria bacterium]